MPSVTNARRNHLGERNDSNERNQSQNKGLTSVTTSVFPAALSWSSTSASIEDDIPCEHDDIENQTKSETRTKIKVRRPSLIEVESILILKEENTLNEAKPNEPDGDCNHKDDHENKNEGSLIHVGSVPNDDNIIQISSMDAIPASCEPDGEVEKQLKFENQNK